jgi:hypothetical protein
LTTEVGRTENMSAVLSRRKKRVNKHAVSNMPEGAREDHNHSAAWRSLQKDPWLCVPSLQMVCLCRGPCTVKSAEQRPSRIPNTLRTGAGGGKGGQRAERNDLSRLNRRAIVECGFWDVKLPRKI